MDPKLLTEARTIAARRDPRAADDLAQELACAALQAGARRGSPTSGGVAGARRAQRGHRRQARRAAARAAGAAHRAAGGARRSGGGAAGARAPRPGAPRAGVAAAPAAPGGAAALPRRPAVRRRGRAAGDARGHGAHARPPRARQPAHAAGRAARDVRAAGRADRGAGPDADRGAAAAGRAQPAGDRGRRCGRGRPASEAAAGGAGDSGGKAGGGRARRRVPTRATSPPCSASCLATRTCSATSRGPTANGWSRSRGSRTQSLIEIRQHFVPEMVKGLEDSVARAWSPGTEAPLTLTRPGPCATLDVKRHPACLTASTRRSADASHQSQTAVETGTPEKKRTS